MMLINRYGIRLTVIGIYLGTTYSSVGYFVSQGPQLICENDRPAIPSVSTYEIGQWVIGHNAQEKAAMYRKATIYDTKRVLGCLINTL
jgi:molecular chaperone DnaK (HSP70)